MTYQGEQLVIFLETPGVKEMKTLQISLILSNGAWEICFLKLSYRGASAMRLKAFQDLEKASVMLALL